VTASLPRAQDAECLASARCRSGAPADLAIMELVDGPVKLVDTRQNTCSGKKKLVPVLTIGNGRPLGRPPPPVPFVI
jgi:predicted amidohydrolase